MINTCKTEGCHREPWKEGFCKRCSMYEQQQININIINESRQEISNLSKKMNLIERKLDNLQIQSSPNYVLPEDIVKPPPITIKDSNTEPFIPTINSIEGSSVNIKQKSKRTTRNLKNIADQLKKIS